MANLTVDGNLTANNVPLVQTITTTGTDLDDYKTAGIYYFSSSYTPTNIPAGVNGWLIVLSTATATNKQIWLRQGTKGTNDMQTWVRTCSSSTWGDWVQLLAKKCAYDSGWTSFSAQTTLSLNHALGTTDFLVVKEVCSVNPSSSSVGSGSSYSAYFTQGDMINSDGTANSYAGGICETGRTTTYIRFEGAKYNAYQYSRAGGSNDVSGSTAYVRIRCFLYTA